MWIRSRRREIAIYLSLGIRKAEILGQFITEAAVVAVAASVIAFAVCQPVAGAIGNGGAIFRCCGGSARGENIYGG